MSQALSMDLNKRIKSFPIPSVSDNSSFAGGMFFVLAS